MRKDIMNLFWMKINLIWKKSWCILNQVINKKKASNTFLINRQITNDKNQIANGFNKYSMNIGPN